MSLPSGKLDRRVTIERDGVETGRNEFNEPILAPPVSFTVWASYRRATARERVSGSEVGAEVSSVFEIRWSQRVRNIDPLWSLIYEGSRYDIIGVFEIGRREGLRIEAIARAERPVDG